MTDESLPRYFKDEAGFCYPATHALAKLPGMTPWDGEVDARGFASDEAEPKAAKATRASRQATRPADTPAGD